MQKFTTALKNNGTLRKVNGTNEESGNILHPNYELIP